MKNFLTTSLLALVVMPVFAGEQSYYHEDAFSPYMAIRGGATYSNATYNFNNIEEHIEDGIFQARAALGLSMYNKYRIEAEGSFFTDLKDTHDFGDMKNVKIKNKNIELMGNMYMDLGHFKYIQPFVGIGAGVAFLDTSIGTNTENSNANTRFSGMGTIGLAMPFGCFSVDIAGRYNYVDLESGMHNFSGDIGIRYMF
ncbi:MAG: outer membrane beta-barrel protein [Alphaproteobacteria bacterium]|nr:outer membrane beta-barrel protein [Alphaproteobacteria bacterium]